MIDNFQFDSFVKAIEDKYISGIKEIFNNSISFGMYDNKSTYFRKIEIYL